jgi:4-hydroxy-tetrahydrodipicolinate synthase
MSADRPAPLRGYIMPLLTPFNADGSVDEQGMRTNIAYLIGEGIHGITLTGSFGEFPLLTEQERIRLYEVAVEEAAGRCTVIAGTAHARTDIVIELGDAAARVGMDGVMMTPPHYLRPSDDDLRLHFGRIAAASKLPVTIYNNPPRVGLNMSVSLLVELSRLDNVVTIKQSSLDLTELIDLIDRTDGQDGFFVTNGQEPRALPALVMGADANYGISPLMLGRECISLYDCVRAGDLAQARAIQRKVNSIRRAFATAAATPAAALRYLANQRGLAGGHARAPIAELSDADKRLLDRAAADAGMTSV